MKISAIKIVIIQFIVTCCFFYIEALMHYNIGKTGEIACNIPPLQDNLKIMGIISIFSALTSIVTFLLEKWLTK
jgi:hypothetical protein|tara:strand:- start:5568 stop:5789 length:222 start_codon:yes stop_codon:yes gene_type:complete